MDDGMRPPREDRDSQRAINAPGVILALIAILVGIHVVRTVMSSDLDVRSLFLFAFLPARYDAAVLQGAVLPGGMAADVWTFFTYAFLHGDWIHLSFNCVWLLAFGSAVAWRFGPVRFLLFSAICTAAGAALHLAFHWGDTLPVIGASAAISGHMAAAIRFMFQPGAPLGLFSFSGRATFRVPALSLGEALRDSRVVVFLVAWFGVNLLAGLGALAVAGEETTIAWQAHIGGFVAGLILFPLFDPLNGRRQKKDSYKTS
jgi:membrane associated rhomboid family serine protease